MSTQAVQSMSVAELLAQKQAVEAALRAAKASLPKSVARVSSYTPKGKSQGIPVLQIVRLKDGLMPENVNTFNSFSFGASKARLILAHLEEIRRFAESASEADGE